MPKRKLTQKERRKLVEDNLGIGKIPWDKFKPGVYNYCDKWCEKCEKTEVCFLYFSEEKESKKAESLEDALDVVGDSFSKTKGLIEAIADAEGYDLTITSEQEKEFERKAKLTNPEKDCLVLGARKISDELHSFLKNPEIQIEAYEGDLENIGWHHWLLYPKISRSVQGKLEAKYDDKDDEKFHLDDSRNSAYVAYRSLTICINSLENIWADTKNSEARILINECKKLSEKIEEKLL